MIKASPLRITGITKIEGLTVTVTFNNKEVRLIDFEKLFAQWHISDKNIEYKLLDPSQLMQVELKEHTLCWENLKVPVSSKSGQKTFTSYDIGPDVLYENSTPEPKKHSVSHFQKAARKEA